MRVLRITDLGVSFPDDARPSIQVTAYDTLIGDLEEEETQKLDTLDTKGARVPLSFSSPHPCSCMKKPLDQPSLTN